MVRSLLIVATGFLALTAIPGGVALMFGVYTPPVDMLSGSLFASYLIPGLALAVVVGGSAAVAVVQLVRREPVGSRTAAMAGVVVMTFEFVQVVTIGSPAGPSRVMQVGYFAMGALLVVGSASSLSASQQPRLTRDDRDDDL